LSKFGVGCGDTNERAGSTRLRLCNTIAVVEQKRRRAYGLAPAQRMLCSLESTQERRMRVELRRSQVRVRVPEEVRDE
jgi:hypothetical protein